MFAWWKKAYQRGWATEDDLTVAVSKGQITEAQKAEIMAQ